MYRCRTRGSRIRTSTATNAAIPTAVHISWYSAACAGQRGDLVARVAVAAGLLQPVDHYDAEAVEHRRERQQQRIGPRGEPAHRQVRDPHQHGEPDDVGHQAGRDVPVQAEPGRDVGEGHDRDREAEHGQFGTSPAARQRHRAADRPPDGLGQVRSRAHPAAPGTRAVRGRAGLGGCGGRAGGWCVLGAWPAVAALLAGPSCRSAAPGRLASRRSGDVLADAAAAAWPRLRAGLAGGLAGRGLPVLVPVFVSWRWSAPGARTILMAAVTTAHW